MVAMFRRDISALIQIRLGKIYLATLFSSSVMSPIEAAEWKVSVVYL